MTRLVLIALFLTPVMRAQTDASALLGEKLEDEIQNVDGSLDGVLGVAIIDLTTGNVISYHGEVVFPQASVIKIPIMVEAFRTLASRMAEKVTVDPKEARPGGDLYSALQRGPVTLTIRELITHMIQSSDNTAANHLIEMLGMEKINHTTQELGLRETRLRRIMLDSTAVKRSDENVSTPLEMSTLLRMIYEHKLNGAEDMIAIMNAVDGDFRKTVPPATEVAAKVGEYPGTRTEAALVLLKGRPYAVSVCATFLRPGANPIPEVAAAVHRYFDKLAHSNQYGNRID